MKRGEIYTTSFHDITYVKWMVNKGVHLLTNFLSLVETDTIKRRQASSAKKVDMKCSKIVFHYNKNMDGVDLMVCYEIDRGSKIKYYLRLFFDLFDISVNNTHTEILWSIYNLWSMVLPLGNELSRNKNMWSKQICETVIIWPSHGKVKYLYERDASIVPRTRKIRKNYICDFCKIYLCFINDRNCFAEYRNKI